MKKHYVIIFLLILSDRIIAQSIGMDFPAFAGKTYELVIFQGSKAEKVVLDTIPKHGKFTLTIPAPYAPYTGMCRWLLTNSEHGGGLDMAIPGKGFSVSCKDTQPSNDNIIFDGYDAVYELNRLHNAQQTIIDQYKAIAQLQRFYNATHPLYASLSNEREAQRVAYEKFHQELKSNPNYNARFLPIVNLTQGIPPHLTDDENQAALWINEYITHELDFDALYTSGHWTGVIEGWVQMHTQLFGRKDSFITAFQQAGARISNPIKYTDFVGKVTYFLNKYGKDDYIAGITPIVVNSGKITAYEGATMQVYIKALLGSIAPDLLLADGEVLRSQAFNTDTTSQTLLVFFASDCGHCEVVLDTLASEYATLVKHQVRVVALAADLDANLFKKSSQSFPWKETYCDFKGMNGANFKSYAVPGTPTMVLVNREGKIILRTSHAHELFEKIKTTKI